jgi:hypothetical protein
MNLDHHPTAGLILFEKDNRILLASSQWGGWCRAKGEEKFALN